MPHILFQPRFTFFQLVLGTLYPFIPSNSHVDPFGPILGSTFGYLWIVKEVKVVSPNIPYPVPASFHLIQPILDHLGLKKICTMYIFALYFVHHQAG